MISTMLKNQTLGLMMCLKWEKYMVFQEEVTAEESTDGEVEAQTYNQDSQDSIGEVSIFEKKKIIISAKISFFFKQHLWKKFQIGSCRFSIESS